MKKFGFFYNGYAEYEAESIEEAYQMFNNDDFKGWQLNIEEEEINELDKT